MKVQRKLTDPYREYQTYNEGYYYEQCPFSDKNLQYPTFHVYQELVDVELATINFAQDYFIGSGWYYVSYHYPDEISVWREWENVDS